MAQPYGLPLSGEQAKRAAAAALAESRRNGWAMAVAVVDPAGVLIYFEKDDATQHGSVQVSIDKARSAALFKRPTKVFQDTVTGGGAGLRMLSISGAVPVEGGLPIIVGGQIVGAIGVSGAASDQDGQCAAAGVSALG